MLILVDKHTHNARYAAKPRDSQNIVHYKSTQHGNWTDGFNHQETLK